jgi:hypothetical protein
MQWRVFKLRFPAEQVPPRSRIKDSFRSRMPGQIGEIRGPEMGGFRLIDLAANDKRLH